MATGSESLRPPDEPPEGMTEPEPSPPSDPLLERVARPAVVLGRRARVGAQLLVRKQVLPQARYAFRVDFTSMFLAGLYTGAIFPFHMFIARNDLHASEAVLALMTAAPFIGNLLAMFWAQAMEGKPKIPFVKWSHITARGVVALSMFAASAWPFALIISAGQIIGTVATPAYASIIKDVYPESQRGRLLSLTRVAILAAQIATTFLVGWLMTTMDVSYRVIFPIAALIGVVAALVFARIIPHEEVPQAEADSAAESLGSGSVLDRVRGTTAFVWSTLGILKEDPAYRWFALSVFSYGFGNLLTIPIIPLVQVDILHIDPSQIAILSIMLQVVMILAYFYWGRYVDLRSPQQAVVINILMNTLVPLNYLLTAAIPGANVWILIPAFAISGIVGAGIDISYFSAILTFSGPDNVARYQALQSFLVGIRGTIAPFLGSALATSLRQHGHDLRWAFAVGAAFMLLGAWMQRVAMVRQEQHRRLLDAG